ncbi:MAG: hypothetical protein AAFR90_13530 [Pseudomonadota bacterium]
MQRFLAGLHDMPAGRRRNHIILFICVVLSIVLLMMQAGLWQHSRTFKGPFQQAAGKPGVLIQSLEVTQYDRLFNSYGNSRGRSSVSDLSLEIAGIAATKPHAFYDEIGKSQGQAYLHWQREVMFSLPESIANDENAEITVRYPMRLKTEFTAFVVVLTLIFAAYLYRQSFSSRHADILQGLPTTAILAICYTWLVLVGVFAAVTSYGLIISSLPPTTTIFRIAPAAEILAHWLSQTIFFVLLLSMGGVIASWSAHTRKSGEDDIQQDEKRLLRFARNWGIVIIAGFFIFSSSAQWAGIERRDDIPSASLFGAIPFLDAERYFADASDSARSGIWSDFSARRPIAAAFRSSVAFLGDFNYFSMTIIQCIMLAVAIFLASASIARWRGIWASIAFAAIMMLAIRGYPSTILTEPLGFFWALIAIPLFAEALRKQSLLFALAALGVMTISLFTRMGAMFAIPAVALWVIWQFGSSLQQRIKASILVAMVLISVVGLNTVLSKLYTSGEFLTGSNFSHTLCGLSIGTTWDGCPKLYSEEIKEIKSVNSQGMTSFLYSKALENIKNDPGIFVSRLLEGSVTFVYRSPKILLQGYSQAPPPIWFSPRLFVTFCIIASLAVMIARRDDSERLFWFLLLSSTALSAGFVYFDDGRRVMSSIYPLLSVFLVMGMVGPGAVSAKSKQVSNSAFGHISLKITALVLACCLILPTVSHRLTIQDPRVNIAATKDEHVIYGGDRLTGILVADPKAHQSAIVPIISLSQFKRVIDNSGFENYQPLISSLPANKSFAFIFGLRVEKGERSRHIYLVPKEVVLRPEVKAWRLSVKEMPRHTGRGNYWYFATDAQPVSHRDNELPDYTDVSATVVLPL